MGFVRQGTKDGGLRGHEIFMFNLQNGRIGKLFAYSNDPRVRASAVAVTSRSRGSALVTQCAPRCSTYSLERGEGGAKIDYIM